MLHVTHSTSNAHKKTLAVEIGLSVFMFALLFAPATKASDITADSVIKLVNRARIFANVATLKKNEMLQKAAEEKADDMIKHDYFAHTSPRGVTPWDWIDDADYDYRYAGENLAINFTNVEDEQKAWMDSPLHRKNILNSNYDEIGVAVKQGVIDGHETTVVVQMFGKQMQGALASNDQNLKTMQTEVLGAQSSNAEKESLSEIFENNKSTLIGWLSVFAVVLAVVLIDLAAIIHKRYEPLFIFHKTKTHNF